MAAFNTKTFSPKEIGVAINNALVASSRPDEFLIPEVRLRRLSEYTQALIQPCAEHVTEGLLDSRELVLVLLSAALLVNFTNNPTGEKLPMSSLAKQVKKKG